MAQPGTSQRHRPRGRPLGFDRDAALEALMELFWEKGYDATTQADMAARTGLATSSLFNSFGDKPAIFRAAIQRYRQRSAAMIKPLTAGTAGLADLAAFLDRLEAHVRHPAGPSGCLMTNAMTDLAGRQPDITQLALAYRQRLHDAALATLRRAAGRGELPAALAPANAAVITAATLGVLAVARASPDPTEALDMISGLRTLARPHSPQTVALAEHPMPPRPSAPTP
jgi:TetR/AcrR family transcriptional regulator, transcriptional repressor for nem operon